MANVFDQFEAQPTAEPSGNVFDRFDVQTRDVTGETQASIRPPDMPADPNEDAWRTGDFWPVARNLETGEISLAVPEVIRELIGFAKLPGDVQAGRADPNDPETIDRAAGLAFESVLGGVGGSPARGLSRAAGELRARARGTDVPLAPETPRAPEASPRPSEAVQPQSLPERVDVPGEPPKAGTVVEGDFAGNINLNRINTPEDVKQVIRETAEQAGGFEDARRGTMTFRETEEMADLLGMTPADLTKRTRGQAFNAEEMFAARRLLVEASEDFFEKARLAKENAGPAERSAALESLTRLVAIQEQVSGATVEAGRALSQFRMMAESRQQSDALKQLVEQSGGRLDDVLDKVTALDDPAKVARFANQAWKAKTSDKIFEVWVNALLSGPQTHAVNMMSNALVAAWGVPESLTASGISKITGSGIPTSEALGRLFGIVEGAKDGIRAGWRAFLTEEPSDLMSKVETQRHRAVGGVTGQVVRLPGRALTAEDEFFKAIGYRQEINAQAARQAFAEKLTGRAFARRVAELKLNPTEAMQKAARLNAQKQTFTNPLGRAGSAVQSVREKVPAVRYVVPFLRTPMNIIKFAGDRSPLAPLFKDVRADLSGANGPVVRDQAIARMTLGSMVGATAAYMAGEGHITGGGPSDPKEKALLYRSGWQPYSVKIGDTYYSFGRLEPLGMLAGVSADFTELAGHMSEEERENVAALIMGSISKNLVSKTWLRGPAELIEAVQDPDRYGDRYIQGLIGTIVPTGVAQVARVRDPHLREARSMLDSIRERIPGQREQLPVRRDVFGDPITLEGGVGPDIISPVYQSVAKNDPAVSELLRLKVFPGQLRREINGVELTPEEYETYQVHVGRTIKKGLDALVSIPQWQQIPDDVRAELMGDMIRKARDIGRTATLMQNPDLIMRIAQERAKQQISVPQASQPPQ